MGTPGSMEVELKFQLLSPTPLDSFTAVLGLPSAILEQRNHYVRSPKAPDLMVRLRQERTLSSIPPRPPIWVLTLKGKRLPGATGVFVRSEEECTLETDLADAAQRGDWQRILEGHALTSRLGGPWSYLGELRNVRHTFPWHGVVLELDQTWFPGDTSPSWELEVECTDPEATLPEIEALLRHLGLPHRPQTKGKFSRFLKAVEGQSQLSRSDLDR